jgi:hypothetical protein
MKAFLAVVAIAAMATSAQAVALKLQAINTAGNSTPALPTMGTLPPTLTPNAKGFMIRILPEDGASVPLGIQNLNVTGSGLVQVPGPQAYVDADPTALKDPLRVQTRGEANGSRDYLNDNGLPALNYPREDTYLASTNWSIVSTPPSVQPSGNPGDTLWNIGGAAFSVGSNVPDNGQGIDFLYLVTTADARIKVLIARGQTGTSLDYVLNYEAMTLAPIPEPSTIVLAGLGLVGLVFAWRRRK